MRRLLPRRRPDAHKGAAGRVLLVAGSTGMTGAAVLAARAALRGGAGLVYLAAPAGLCPSLEARLIETIIIPLPGGSPGVAGPGAADLILEKAGQCTVLAAGPGLAALPETAALLETLLEQTPVPLLLDAGALGALAGRTACLARARQPLVLTPHAGEMARLAGLAPAEVQRSRPETARRFAREWGCTLLLKGANTVIGAPGGMIYFNPTGSPALATAGTGDLLTGLIAALIAQGLAPEEAAQAGAYIHGLAGDLLPFQHGCTASDVLEAFPRAFQHLNEATPAPSPYLKPVRG
ncbi:MAG: NAD(P)H-hydrate dehydratase [Bacillota bacterium]